MLPAVALGQSISYALHYRVPISNELTSNPVNPAVALEESISYALQCRVPISNERTINPVYLERLGIALGKTGREY